MAKWRLSHQRARRLGEQERAVGIDADDEAARWLAENDPTPDPPRPKSAGRSKELHRWRQRRGS